MRKSDYQTWQQATDYQKLRFAGGLSAVAEDEAKLLNLWLPKRGSIYLDLGSGTGRAIETILTHQPKIIYALDASKAMLTHLRRVYIKEVGAGKIKTIHAMSDEVPLPDQSVDVITCLHLFKHLPNIGPTVREAYRVLKKGGYLIFDVLNSNSLVRLRAKTCFMLSEEDLRSIFSSTGFKVKKRKYIHPFGETIYKIVGARGANIVHIIDSLAGRLLIGTKIFVLAKK